MSGRFIQKMMAIGLIALSSSSLFAAAAGSCITNAVSVTFPADGQSSSRTLVRRWNDSWNAWYDGKGDSAPVSEQRGAYFVQASLAPNKPYVIWVTNAGGATLSPKPAYRSYDYPDTAFSAYRYGGQTYYYVQKWHGETQSVTYYFLIDGYKDTLVNFCHPGEVFDLHTRQGYLSDVLPPGSELTPVSLGTLAEPGSRSDTIASGETYFYYTAQLTADTVYHFTATPQVSGETAKLWFLDAAEESYEVVKVTDPDTGISTAKLTAKDNVTMTIVVEAKNTSNLAWTQETPAKIGFSATTYEVDGDAGYAELTVNKTGGFSSARVIWGTVSETAQAGVDYLPASNVLEWATAEDISPRTIRIRLIPPVDTAEPGRTFAVRLEAATDDGAVRPIIDPFVARVVPVYAGKVKPSPVVPTADDEPPETELAVGTFRGVLSGGTGDVATNGVYALSQVELLSTASGTRLATVRVNGCDYYFTGSAEPGTTLRATTEIGGRTFESVLLITPPSGTVGDLQQGAGEAMSVTLSLYVEMAGQPVELSYAGSLFRDESRLNSNTLARMKGLAGTYSYALDAGSVSWMPEGCGILTLDVSVGGDVSVRGKLGDGTAFALTAAAYETLSDVAVPIYWSDGLTTFGGTLLLSGNDTRLVWRDDRAQYGGAGEDGLCLSLLPQGGAYDGTRCFSSLFLGYRLLVDNPDSAFDGLELTATAQGFACSDASVAFSFDAATGIIAGTKGNASFGAVLLPGRVGFLGYEIEDGVSHRFAVEAVWTDPDWSENWGWTSTLTFDIGSASGSAPDIVGSIGGHVLLPDAGADTFSRPNYRLLGWLRADTGATYAPGQIPTPACDTTFTAIWQMDGVDEVLGCPGAPLLFSSPSASVWFVAETNDTRLMQSGAVAKGGTSVFKATVLSEGVVTFSWKCHTDEAGYAGCKFAINGVERATIADKMSDWAESAEFDVQAGDELTWTFWRASNAYDLPPDCAWLRRLTFGKRTTVTFRAVGGDPKTEWTTNVIGYAGSETLGDYLAAMPKAVWNTEMVTDWVAPTGGVVTLDWIFPETDTTLVPLEVVPRRFFITYDANGGQGQVPTDDPKGHTNLEVVAVAAGSTLYRTDGYVFAGWKIGDVVYDPENEQTKYYTFGAADVTAYAQWKLDYAAVLGCKGANLTFLNESEYPWIAVSNDVDSVTGGESGQNLAMMQSAWISEAQSSAFTVEAGEAGTMEFSWRISSDDDPQYSWGICATNGIQVQKISQSDASGTAWRRVTLALDKGNRVTWTFGKASKAYTKPDTRANEDRVCLKEMTWIPAAKPTYDFVISWSGNGVTGAVYSIDSAASVAAVNGATVAVPNGSAIAVSGLADINEWYYISSGEGTFTLAGSTTLTAAKRDSGSLPQDLQPADLGLSIEPGAPFADADVNELSKVIAWAQAQGKKVSDMNALVFSEGSHGDPMNDDAKAYLLNCAVSEIAAEAARFRITAFGRDDKGQWTLVPADTSAYGNGFVDLRTAADPRGPFTAEVKEGASLFYRIYLVK